jgi:hypothetical protein
MSESAQASQSSGRSVGLANLTPWKPGQTGNPSGRPRGLERLAREHTEEALSVLVNSMRSNDERIALTAAGLILDRGWGKPVQAISGGDDAASITFLHLIAARASSDALNNRVFDAEHTDVATDETIKPASRNLMEPAQE